MTPEAAEVSAAEVPAVDPAQAPVVDDGQSESAQRKAARAGARSRKLQAVAREPPPPAEFQAVARAGDRALADIIAALGTEGRYKIKVYREQPREWFDRETNQRIEIAGFLKEYTQPIDEAELQRNHGGGRYVLKFFRQEPSGSYRYATPSQMTIDIGGDPRLDDVPRTPRTTAPPSPTTATPSESPAVVTRVVDILAGQVQRQQEPRGPDPMITLLQQQLEAQNAELRALRADLLQARTAKPAEDTFKDKWLEKLVDGDSARVNAVKTTLESEIRMVKEAAIANEARIREQAAADRAEMRAAHSREIDLIRQSHEQALASVKLANEVQKSALESENKRLERALADAKEELKELRAKKDKSLLEQAQDIEKLKETLGVDGESSTVDKVLTALPEVLPMVGGWFGRGEKPKEEKPKPKVVQTPNGERFLQKADGNLVPIKKKAPAAPAAPAAGEPPAPPAINQEQMTQLLNYLTRSFDNNANPDTVAQSHRAHVPEWLMQLLRVNSVDDVFFKMAQLPSGSSLTTQRGRLWLRRVGAALVGG